jgi:hypothetical protein
LQEAAGHDTKLVEYIKSIGRADFMSGSYKLGQQGARQSEQRADGCLVSYLQISKLLTFWQASVILAKQSADRDALAYKQAAL